VATSGVSSFFFFKLVRKPANTAATKTSSQRKHGFRRMRATISTSSGDPIRPLVAEILNINLLIGQGGEAAACLCGRCVCWLAREFEKKRR
jgi:hypothetical protein